MTEAVPIAQLTGWLRFPDQAKLDAACALVRERLHLAERQPDHLTLTFADGVSEAAADVRLLGYQPLKHPLTLLAKGATAGWLDLRFAPETVGAPRDQRFYAGGHPAYRYEHAEEVDHFVPATYRASDGIANPASPFRSVALSPDGTLCALAGGERFGIRTVCVRRSCVVLIESHSGTEVGRLYGHAGVVNALAFSADGMTVAVGDGDMGLRVYEVKTGAVLASRKPSIHTFEPRSSGGYALASSIDAVQYLPDERLLTLGGTHVGVWEARKLTLRRDLAVGAMHEGPQITRMAVHPEGHQVICIAQPTHFRHAQVQHETGALIPLDLERNAVGEAVPGLFVDVAYSPDGNHLAVVDALASSTAPFDRYDQRFSTESSQFAKRISLLDAATLQPRWTVASSGNPQRLVFLPDGSAFVTLGVEDDEVVLRRWSTTDGAQLTADAHSWRGTRGICTDLAQHDTRLVVVTGDAARVFHVG